MLLDSDDWPMLLMFSKMLEEGASIPGLSEPLGAFSLDTRPFVCTNALERTW